MLKLHSRSPSLLHRVLRSPVLSRFHHHNSSRVPSRLPGFRDRRRPPPKPLTYPLQSPLPSVDLVVIASCGTGEIRLSSDISNASPICYTGFSDHSDEILASAYPSAPHYLHLCRRDQADWYLEMGLHFSVMDLSSSVEFPLTISVLILKRTCSTCQWISFSYKTSLFTRYGNIGVQSIISETHPAMDLFHFSSDPFTSTSPQPLKPHLPVVVMIKAPTLSLIWRHRLHSSGFIKSTLTLSLRLHLLLVAGSTVQDCARVWKRQICSLLYHRCISITLCRLKHRRFLTVPDL